MLFFVNLITVAIWLPFVKIMNDLHVQISMQNFIYNFLSSIDGKGCYVCGYALLHSTIACHRLFGINLNERKEHQYFRHDFMQSLLFMVCVLYTLKLKNLKSQFH